MKKTICSFLTITLTILACISLSACGDEKKYVLSTFYNTYINISDKYEYLKLTYINNDFEFQNSIAKVDVDYSTSPILDNLVRNSSSKYSYLESFYHPLLDNALAPMYFYSQQISASNNVSKTETQQLFEALEKLEKEFGDIDNYQAILIARVQASSNEDINLSQLRTLFEQYEQAIDVACDLSNLVCEIYFNKVLTNDNVDYSHLTPNTLSDADLINISTSTRNRIHYYKFIYASVYNELYVENAGLADKIIKNGDTSIPAYDPYDYISDIESLTSNAITVLTANRDVIYEYAIALYNLQEEIELEYKLFNNASNKISYANIGNKATNNEINYANAVSRFANGIAYDSYEILDKLDDKLFTY